MKLIQEHTDRDKIISILGGLALFLSIIEHVIPKPIPFIRIGLANIPILISLILLTPRDTIFLILIKSIGSSLVTGTIFSWIFLYSLTGSIVSGVVMLLFYNIFKKRISMIGVSLIGALANNLMQILMATLFLGSGAKYIGIPILIIGFISGIVIGHTSNTFIQKSQWVRSHQLKI